MSEGLKQIDFARLIGVSKSYVTALKKQGRLEFTPGGLVDVAASLERMEKTADPNRDDMREFWANYRGAAVGPVTTGTDIGEASEREADLDESDLEGASETYYEARSLKEHYLAALAEANYKLAIGELITVADLEDVSTNAAVYLRTQIEGIPDRLGAELASAGTADRIKAQLTTQTDTALTDAQRLFETQFHEATNRSNKSE